MGTPMGRAAAAGIEAPKSSISFYSGVSGWDPKLPRWDPIQGWELVIPRLCAIQRPIEPTGRLGWEDGALSFPGLAPFSFCLEPT